MASPAYIEALEVQLGTVAATDAWGTEKTPTVKLMGIDSISLNPIMRSEQVAEKRGSLAPAYQSIRVLEEGTGSMGGVVLYQDLPYLFEGLFGAATPATDASATFTRTYKAPLTTFDTDLGAVPNFTLVYGGEVAGVATDTASLNGATVNSLTISGEDGAPWRFAAEFIGKNVTKDAIVAALADRTVEVVMGDQTALAIDPATDAAGSTAIPNTGFSFEVAINSNRALVRHLGNLQPDEYRDAPWTGTLNLMLELGSDARPYLADILTTGTQVEKVIRITGSTGSGATARSVQINFNGILLEAPSLFTDNDGVVTVELVFTGQYNSVLANWLTVVSLNDIASLA